LVKRENAKLKGKNLEIAQNSKRREVRTLRETQKKQKQQCSGALKASQNLGGKSKSQWDTRLIFEYGP